MGARPAASDLLSLPSLVGMAKLLKIELPLIGDKKKVKVARSERPNKQEKLKKVLGEMEAKPEKKELPPHL